MTIRYFKKAALTSSSGEENVRHQVASMLAEIEAGGEATALEYSKKLDNFSGSPRISAEQIALCAKQVSPRLKADIGFAYDRVRHFAEAQKASIQEFESEISPGMWAGQKLIPMQCAGCYVPAGRYAHVASAIMSITTAKAAGVDTVIACSVPQASGLPHAAIVYAMDLCGADVILCLGGVQAIAAMAFGLFSGKRADILVGPGNKYVAEAKRLLFGRVGIDLFAGPTEIAVIADSSASSDIVAQDLVSQMEHGFDSPAWLITDSDSFAASVVERVDFHIARLPDTARQAAESSWANYGEVVVCETREEMAQVSDSYAAEHLELQTSDNAWFCDRLRNYGSLFVGEETTVTYGDKCSGTNHILPTKGAGRYTGGLSVHKFIKVVTTQRMTREANRVVAPVAARLSRLEGMEAHARAGDARVHKYFPDEQFALQD